MYYSLGQLFFIWFVWLQRMDLGECPKIHDLALRADFELASKTKDYFYDIDVSILAFSNVFFNSIGIVLYMLFLQSVVTKPS